MTNEQKIIKNKLGLLRLAEQLGNVSQACACWRLALAMAATASRARVQSRRAAAW